MSKSILAIVIGLAFAGWTLAAEHPTAKTETKQGTGKLDGKSFVGEIGKKGEKKGDKDEFIFKDGKFLSTACEAYGFHEAPYTATEKDGVISFTCEVTNDKSEKMSWKGECKKDEIEGTAVNQTKDSKVEYWFKGTLKTGAAATEPPKKSEHPEHPHSEHPK